MVLVADRPVIRSRSKKQTLDDKSPDRHRSGTSDDEGFGNVVELVVSAPLLQLKGQTSPSSPVSSIGAGRRFESVAPLALGDEIDAIVKSLGKLKSSVRVHVRSSIGTIDNISSLLFKVDSSPVVLHFMGHGTETSAGSALLLEDSTGIATILNSADLRLFLSSRHSVPPCQLAILNACHSAGLADVLLAVGVRHVIAVSAPDRILDEAARLFSRNLYPALFSGHSVQDAFEHARNSVRIDPKLRERIDPHTWRPVNWDEALKFRLLPENSQEHSRQLSFTIIPGETVTSVWDRTNLATVSADPFVGRQQSIHELAEELQNEDEKRCVMLHGMGGMGKTALAEAVGRWQHERRNWSDGVWFVELRQTTRAAQARDKIAAILRFSARSAANDELLARAIDSKRLLLILNDVDELFQHDPDNGCLLLKSLMSCGGVRLLVTGRHDLPGIVAYNRYEVPRLDSAGALAAFQRYAPPIDKWGGAATRVVDLDELITFLDGYPFPIRLAATYLQQTRCSLRDFLARLKANPLPTLRYPNDSETRDTSLAATLDISYDALPPGAREVFPLLGIFPNGLTSTAAHEILGSEGLLALEMLLVFSMAEVGEGLIPRFVMPEPARLYAERMQLPDAIDRVFPRALEFYHEFIRTVVAKLSDSNGLMDEEARLSLIQEQANILRILDWGYESETPNSEQVSWSAHATAMLTPYWIQVATGQHSEAFRRLERASLAARRLQDSLGEAQVYEAVADLRTARGEFQDAAMSCDMAIAGFRLTKHGRDEARVQEKKANALVSAELPSEAQQAYLDAANAYRHLGDCAADETRVLRRLLEVTTKSEQYDTSILICNRVLALCIQLRDLAGKNQIEELLKAIRSQMQQ